mmetsp:Transcript_2418/g.2751  ORF Transcript_2418/g.2751 Transcript_2418/m.2751 type:complete len:655 (-) Transcript_2418:57-2021(-)|eukprot:CAMPEP_0184019528 /NCGR_PEP_ID=MMETSP0954-20121128/8803_1 /TAXON_ID=627963 /ORGANISM="Aplanochytrium sp, Strain PBS07" /LENGTH=654 /DNA_ID=CAMNT_0026301207 /DNA_START=468 /DNA_END=2432 /DNA_ORIENTATION=-
MAPNEDKLQLRSGNVSCMPIKDTTLPEANVDSFQPEDEDIVYLSGVLSSTNAASDWVLKGTWGYPSYPDISPQDFKYDSKAACSKQHTGSVITSTKQNRDSSVEQDRCPDQDSKSGSLESVDGLPELSKWSGYFENSLENGSEVVKEKIFEKFEMKLIALGSGQSNVSGHGSNQFGRFQIKGTFSKTTNRLKVTKTYIDPVSSIVDESPRVTSSSGRSNKTRDKAKNRRSNTHADSDRKKAPRRCIICVNNGCSYPKDCRGKGGRMYHDCQICLSNSSGGVGKPASLLTKRQLSSCKDDLKKRRKRSNPAGGITISALHEKYQEELIQLLNRSNRKRNQKIDVEKYLLSLSQLHKGARCRTDLILSCNASSNREKSVAAEVDKKVCEKIRKLASGWGDMPTFHGYPLRMLSELEVFRGLEPDQERNGYGVCAFGRMYVFEGQWLHGSMDGRGVISTKKGSIVYQGEFVRGKISGVGSMFFDNGSRYDGEWNEGMMNGYGIFAEFNGDLYVGEWLKNCRSGHGRAVWKDGTFYEGEWCNNKPHGTGYFHAVNGFTYDGIFKDGEMKGRGKCWWKNRDQYEGSFNSGRMDGRGTYKFSNGAVYEGRFRNDTMEGHGVLKMEDEPVRLSADQMLLPINYTSEMRFIHMKAGFGDDGQ